MYPFAKNTVKGLYTDVFDNLFDEAKLATKLFKYSPNVDLAEDDKAYYLHASLPGMKKEEIQIQLDNGVLTLSGEKKLHNESEGKKFHRVESYHGSFSRSFSLPEHVNTEAITAEYTDGILSLTIPKDEKKSGKQSIVIQ